MKNIEVHRSKKDKEALSIRVRRVAGGVALAGLGLATVGEIADSPIKAEGEQSVNAENLENALEDNTEGVGDNGVSATEASRYVADQLGEGVMDQANTTGVFTVPESIENIDNNLVPFEQSEDWEFDKEPKE